MSTTLCVLSHIFNLPSRTNSYHTRSHTAFTRTCIPSIFLLKLEHLECDNCRVCLLSVRVCCRGMSCRSYCSVELLMWIKHNIDDSSQFTIVCLPTEFRVTRVACVHCQCSVSRMFQWICRTVLRSGPIIASGQNEFSLYYLQTHDENETSDNRTNLASFRILLLFHIP